MSPDARPASTKSLCSTRRSSGRVTRAMLTPNPMPTDQITTHSDPPQTAEIIIAMISTGKAIRMSTNTATDSRTQRAVSAPSAASAMPMTVATTPAPTATITVVRAPAMTRLRMSRPDPSVPSRCGQLGRRPAIRDVDLLRVERRPEERDDGGDDDRDDDDDAEPAGGQRPEPAQPRPARAAGDAVARRSPEPVEGGPIGHDASRCRGSITRWTRSTTKPTMSTKPVSTSSSPCTFGQVARAHVRDEHPSDAGQREELLDHDGADDDAGDLQAEHRDDREPDIRQAVADERGVAGEALRGGGADVVLTDRLQRGAAHEAHEHRALDDADRERGQQQRAERRPRVRPAGAGEALRGQPAEPHREDDDEHHARPDHRHRGEGLRADAERRAAAAAAPHGREHARAAR